MDHHVPWQIESKGFEDCCVLVGPRKGRKYTTNPEYEFYAKYHAPNTEDSCDTQADTIESKMAVRGASQLSVVIVSLSRRIPLNQRGIQQAL